MINTFSKFYPVLPLILLLACAGIASAQNPGTGNVPEIKKDCAICHVNISEGPALNKPLSDLCLDCHPGRKAPAEHKVDIVPSMTVRKLPLSEGNMTCITCHDPHADPYGNMLRERTKDLCFECHKY